MQDLIPWDDKPATVTTETFKRIKDFVLNLKENPPAQKVILTAGGATPESGKDGSQVEVHATRDVDRRRASGDSRLCDAAEDLAGEPRILLAPELLNNLAASFVLEARRNRKGLGSLEERDCCRATTVP